jgi:hypothetical protein
LDLCRFTARPHSATSDIARPAADVEKMNARQPSAPYRFQIKAKAVFPDISAKHMKPCLRASQWRSMNAHRNRKESDC